MQRCFVLHDVQSQSEHSARQRREQLIHEHTVDEEGHDDSDTDSGDLAQTKVPDTQEEEEVYRVTIDDDETFKYSASRSQCRGEKSFETTIQDTIAGYREFQRQSFQQLRLGGFDQDDYDEFKKAEAIFIALDLPKHTRFYWACINALKELVFWRKYFIDISRSSNEDKLQLLEAMTGVSRNNQDVPKQLGPCHSFGSPNLGGLSYGSPSSWGTPPNAPQWGTPPNAPQWGTPPNFQQGGSSGTTPANVQYGFSLGGQGEHMRNTQQASPSGLGFTNYFETGQIPQTPRPGGFFNIWGTPQEKNASHQSDVGDED
ncbi:unnamed protein product [Arabidopsis lyrata]|nr:unnamed protein product [Arabidopsis lyrata]